MNVESPKNLPASVKQRLLNLARTEKQEFNAILTRYALERFLYRIGASRFRSRFILKGALLFSVWQREFHRTTQDADFLNLDTLDMPRLIDVFREICEVKVEPDGIQFLAASVQAQEIRENNPHGGLRVNLAAMLGKARVPLQIDVGFGDAVVPKEEEIIYPVLLDFPAPQLKSYHKEGMIAEKFHAAVSLGMRNSRMKDYFDIHALSQAYSFLGAELSRAIAATFKKQKTEIPRNIPPGLSAEFAADPARRIQWRSFLIQVNAKTGELDFEKVVKEVADFLMPPALAAAEGKAFEKHWPAKGPWHYNGENGGNRGRNQRKKP